MIYFALIMCVVNLYLTVTLHFKDKKRMDEFDSKRKWWEIVEQIKKKGEEVSYEQFVDKRIM